MSWVERIDGWIQSVGPWGYLVLFVAALIEYVFPPFPGDSVMLLGGVYAVRGDRPWPLVLLAVTVGSVVGALVDFWVGARIGRRLESPGVMPDAIARQMPRIRQIEEQMRRRGALLLLANRFLPGIRAVIFVAAGFARMPVRSVLLWGTASALLFNSAVIGLGFAVGGNVEKLATVLARYQQAVWVLVAIAGAALLVRWLASRRRALPPA